MRYFLGIDNGGTSTKASVYDERGRELVTAAATTNAIYPAPGFAERDMEEMWRTNCRVIREAVERSGLCGKDISAVAVCGHGKGLYLWGKDGRGARRAILSADNRATAVLKRLQREGLEEKLFPLTLQHMMACQPAQLLIWLREHEPQTVENIRWIFSCKDYLRFRLTGCAAFEKTDASGSGLINLNSADYDGEILSLLGLSELRYALPPLKNADEVCGCITTEAARLTGLEPGTPVAGGMFDIDACALAVGAVEPDRLCMIAGTWSINEYPIARPILDGSVRMNSLFCIPGTYLAEDSSPTSAGNLEWYIRSFFADRKENGTQESIYDVLSRLALSVPPGEDCPVFVPYLNGGARNGAARGGFFGLSSSHTRAHLTRAVYEGIAMGHRFHMEELKKSNSSWSRICLSGGAARSPFWAQMFADVMQMPVEAAKINECGTLGCAMAAAVACGVYPSLREASEAMRPSPVSYAPNSGLAGYYDRKYARYLRCLSFAEQDWI